MMHIAHILRFVPLLAILVFPAALARAEDKPPRVPSEAAKQHAGKRIEVVFEVKAAKNSVHRKTVFLDSMTDFRTETRVHCETTSARGRRRTPAGAGLGLARASPDAFRLQIGGWSAILLA